MANIIARPQVNILDACKIAIKKCVTFTGRARRSEFWWAQLALLVISFIVALIPFFGKIIQLFLSLLNISLTFRRLHDTNHTGWWVGANIILGIAGMGIIMIAAIMGGFSVADLTESEEYLIQDLQAALMGSSIMNLFIGVLCFIASGLLQLIILVFCCLDSDFQTNKYGESPKYYMEGEEQKDFIL